MASRSKVGVGDVYEERRPGSADECDRWCRGRYSAGKMNSGEPGPATAEQVECRLGAPLRDIVRLKPDVRILLADNESIVSRKNTLLSASCSFFDRGEKPNEGRVGLYAETEERRPRGEPRSDVLVRLFVEKSKWKS